MGARGPKPKPTALKVFEGTRVRNKKQAQHEAKPESKRSFPEPPSHLGKWGKKTWNETGPALYAVNLLTIADLPAFSLYCSEWDRWHAARIDIDKTGINIITAHGVKQNPSVRTMNAATANIKQLGAQFGMTPSARVGMNAPVEDKGHDELEDFKSAVS